LTRKGRSKRWALWVGGQDFLAVQVAEQPAQRLLLALRGVDALRLLPSFVHAQDEIPILQLVIRLRAGGGGELRHRTLHPLELRLPASRRRGL